MSRPSLWRSVGKFPADMAPFTENQRKFLLWVKPRFGVVDGVWCAWSARDAMTPTTMSHRRARRMLHRLTELGVLERSE